METIYLDNNATTRPDERAVSAMLPYLQEFYGNASSVHRFGQRARQAVEEARAAVAGLIGCQESQLVFTGCATESVNAAIVGILAARAPRSKIITSAVEHSATLGPCNRLAEQGCQVVWIGVNRDGELDLPALNEALDEQTALVSIMWANNETGVIFPMEKIGAMCRERGVPLHTDASQAVGKIPVDVQAAPVDAMSFAGHKFHGPKGVGGLFLRRGLRIRPLLVGGPQERNRRGGTENVPGIAAMGKAAELAREALDQMPRVAALRDHLESEVLRRIDQTQVNGGGVPRLPNTTNISFASLQAEAILLLLSEQGICASAGAACSSGSLEPSHVLKAMGIDQRMAHGAIRFSLSRFTTAEEIDKTLQILPGVIDRLRRVLPAG